MLVVILFCNCVEGGKNAGFEDCDCKSDLIEVLVDYISSFSFVPCLNCNGKGCI